MQLVVIDEDLEVASLGEIDLRRQERCRAKGFIAAACEVGERCRQQGSADAVSEDVALLFAGLALNHRSCRQYAFLHVVFERLVCQPLIGIDPGDDEYREALLHDKPDE